MADGFSSTADLNVVVDVNGEMFARKMKDAAKTVSDFQQTSDRHLKQFDTGFSGFVKNVTAKAGLIGDAINGALAAYEQFAKQGREYAKAIGAEKEYDSFIASIGELGLTLKDTATAGFFALAASAQATAADVSQFRGQTVEAKESTDNWVASLLKASDVLVKELSAALKVSSGTVGETSQEMDVAADRAEALAKRAQDIARSIESTGAQYVIAAPIIAGLDKLAEYMDSKAAEIRRTTAAGLAAGTIAAGNGFKDLEMNTFAQAAEEVRALDRKTEAIGRTAGEVAKLELVERELNRIIAQGVAPTEAQIRAISALGDEVAIATSKFEAASNARREAEEATRKAEAANQARDKFMTNIDVQVDNLRNQTRFTGELTEQQRALMEETKLLNQARAQGIQLGDAEVTKIRAVAAETARLHQTQSHGIAVRQKTIEAEQMFGSVASTVSRAAGQAFTAYVDKSKKEADQMSAILEKLVLDLRNLIIQKLVVDNLTKALTMGFSAAVGGGSGDALSGGLASFFGGFRAEGGPVVPGREYIVGERGEERFVPSVPGYIMPNEGRSGAPAAQSANVQVNVINNADGTKVERRSRETGGGRIEDIIISTVSQGFANGQFDGPMAGRFGAGRQSAVR